jgi:acetyl esterase/lipase
MATVTQHFTTDDIEYLRHGDRPLMMRLFRPLGEGPFPVVVDLHGGAWNDGDFTRCQDHGEGWTRQGLAVAALDFRHAADRYPTSLADINYAIRWIKARAEELRLDAARVGLAGQSSGGHLAMLTAMRPHDPRYTEIPLGEGASAIDASVACVGMAWPVMNPLSRYRHAKRCVAADGASSWADGMPRKHEIYWVDEETMAEGNPMLALERGESVEILPALWVQGKPDIVHDYLDPDSDAGVNEPERFARNYRNAGGEIEVVYVDYPTREGPPSIEPLGAFFRKHLG